MRALVMEGFGEPSRARVSELPTHDISSGEVLVRIGAAAVNPLERRGKVAVEVAALL